MMEDICMLVEMVYYSQKRGSEGRDRKERRTEGGGIQVV